MTVFTNTRARQLLAVWFVCFVYSWAAAAHAQAGLEHLFDAPEGSQLAGLALAADGGAYLTLSAGGPTNQGVLARYTPDGKVRVLHAFGATPAGITPIVAPSIGSDGAVYGATSQGGAFGYGALFRLDHCRGLQVVHDFSATDGGHVVGPLLAAADGGWYAVTYGTYEGNPDAEIIGEPSWFQRSSGKLLYVSSNGDARALVEGLTMPAGGVIQAGDGYLYGALPLIPGGSHEPTVAGGNLYRVKPDGTDYFAGLLINPAGFNPRGELVEGPDGYLYGVSDDIYSGDGPKVFRTSRDFGSPTSEYQELAFEGSSKAGLAFGSDGNLYGAGYAFFRLTSSGVVTHIRAFDGDSPQPSAALKVHPDGGFFVPSQDHLLRMAQAGGMTTLHRFGYRDGAELGQLWHARDGQVYGTTLRGGDHGSGTLFRFKADGTFETLFSWPVRSALQPYPPKAPLVEGLDGTLYGMRADQTSSLFSVTTTGTIETLHVFEPALAPYRYFEVNTALAQCLDGALYGTTRSWDQALDGTFLYQEAVFRLQPGMGELSVIGRIEGRRLSSLICGQNGALYAISSTASDSIPRQALVSITPDGTISTLHEFASGSDGDAARSNLVEAADGSIYGFAQQLSAERKSFIYRWASGTGVWTTSNLDGWNRYSTITLSITPDGTLFGNEVGAQATDGTTASFTVAPSGQFTPLAEPTLGTLVSHDGEAYRIEPITRDGYYGFRLSAL